MAILAYKNKQIKLIIKSVETFSVPKATLRARLKGRKLRAETRANSYKLTSIEEKTLV